jgi:hypothetical protein
MAHPGDDGLAKLTVFFLTASLLGYDLWKQLGSQGSKVIHFLVATLEYMLRKFCAEAGIDFRDPRKEDHPNFPAVCARLKAVRPH